jgi:sphinganine-1-phosphate aldolase
MDDLTKEFLGMKLYGLPYMPRNISEVGFLIQLWLQSASITVKSYVFDTYITGHWYICGLNIIKDVLFLYIFVSKFSELFVIVRGYGLFRSIARLFQCIQKSFFQLMLNLPPIKAKVNKEVDETILKMGDSIMKNNDSLLQFPSLPDSGLSAQRIEEELDNLQQLDHSDWVNGRVSGAVYHGGDDLLQLQSAAYFKYSVANQLHPDVFPGVRKMESEVVSMVLKLFNAPESGCGCSTSGGTESLLLTGLAAREFGRRYKRIYKPEVIAPVTVHAGIEKACYYFGMKLHKVDLDPVTYKVDIAKVRKLINSNTVLLVGSAPNYPHGIIDDIESLSKLAMKYNIPLHVDACLGSFIVSFLEKSQVHGDLKLPLFDFRLPGVTSISCDTHKYGFAPKGSSIIMYRSPKLRECQYYVSTDWTGGLYGSPTLAGSRPGAIMVGCWATLINIGEDGYKKACFDIVTSAMKLKKAIKTSEILSQYLEVIGDPIGSVISFKVKDNQQSKLNIYELSDILSKKGWHFSTLQNPPALHFAFTRLTVGICDELIDTLVTAVSNIIESNDDKKKPSDISAIYGVAGSVKTTGVADKLIIGFLDTLYKI